MLKNKDQLQKHDELLMEHKVSFFFLSIIFTGLHSNHCASWTIRCNNSNDINNTSCEEGRSVLFDLYVHYVQVVLSHSICVLSIYFDASVVTAYWPQPKKKH